MEVKKTSTGLKVLVGILSLLLLLAVGYIIADKFILNKKVEEKQTQTVEDKKEETKETVKLSEEEVKNLHDSYIIENITDLYKNNNINIETISSKDMLSYGLASYITRNNIQIKNEPIGMCGLNDNDYKEDGKLHICRYGDKEEPYYHEVSKTETLSISKSLIDEEIKNKFGITKKYEAKNLEHYINEIGVDNYFVYSEEDNKFYLMNIIAGYGVKSSSYFKILKSEQDDNNVYVYEKVLRCGWPRCTSYWKNENGVNARDGSLDNDITDANIIEENSGTFNYEYILGKYSDRFYTYKTTFKKADNGTYYWYSSEIVK